MLIAKGSFSPSFEVGLQNYTFFGKIQNYVLVGINIWLKIKWFCNENITVDQEMV